MSQKKQTELRDLIEQRKKEIETEGDFRPGMLFHQAHNHTPTATAIEEYLQDDSVADFWAEYFQVTVEQFRQWRDHWNRNNQCAGMTQKGHQCKHKGDCTNDPREFYAGYSDRCRTHKRELTEAEKKEGRKRALDELAEFRRLAEKERVDGAIA